MIAVGAGIARDLIRKFDLAADERERGVYSVLTAGPLSRPTHRPSPVRQKLPGWVKISLTSSSAV